MLCNKSKILDFAMLDQQTPERIKSKQRYQFSLIKGLKVRGFDLIKLCSI